MYNVFRKEQVPEDAQMPYCTGLVRHHESSGLGFVKMAIAAILSPSPTKSRRVKTSWEMVARLPSIW